MSQTQLSERPIMASKPVTDQMIFNTDSEVATDFIRCFRACLDQDDFYSRYTDADLEEMGVTVDCGTNRAAFGAIRILWEIANGQRTPTGPDNYLLNLFLLVGKPGASSSGTSTA